MNAVSSRLSRIVGLTAAATILALTGLPMGGLPSAHADTAPDPGTPPTVSNDVLPTWQINGVVWSEVTVGNTVYATGSFSKARPPGVGQGGSGEVPAGNIFAFDITTGAPIANFNHSLNAQGLVVRASPDGSRVYVGGDFTTVDGAAHNHIAAFDTATGALIGSFSPSLNNQVRGIAITNASVYVGGNFSSANGVTRTRLAAFAPANGALQSWAPTADDNKVWSMVMAPDNSRVIVAGSFTTLNHVAAYGMGAVDASTGATLPWAANQTIRDATDNGAIEGLSSDGTQIMGSGWAFGSGASFEGTWSANPYTGAINWLNDCHGDTYDTFPIGQVLYSVSHAHDCSAVGEYPDTNPRTHYQHALAWTTYATGTNTGPDTYGWNYNGWPDSTMLHWYPNLAIGTYTGQNQAAWTVSGNANYVTMGGEFPSVNGIAQQGLVRFAVAALAPNKSGPVLAQATNPTAVSLTPGTARVTWTAAFDLDNRNLTYDLLRDGTTWVSSVVQASKPWALPAMGFIDRGLAPGSMHTYQLKVTDPFGNAQWSAVSNVVTIVSGSQSTYSQDVVADGASSYWRLGEPSGSNVYDWAGFTDATAQSGVARGATGAILGDSDKASTFNGTSSGLVVTNAQVAAPTSFTAEAWVKTTSTQGGKILGYGNSNTGLSTSYDRHIYMDNTGHVWFGVYPGGVRTVHSAGSYNDGTWHYIVGSLSAAGLVLYVDGVQVALDANTTSAQAYLGYWRIGGDSLSGWPSQPTSNFLNGTIDDVAIYPSALPLARIRQHYVDSGRTLPGQPPTAAFTWTANQLVASFDGSGSSDPGGTITSYSWNFGDGSSAGTGVSPVHTYAASGTYTVTLTVTDNQGATGVVSHDVTVTSQAAPIAADTFNRTVSGDWGTADTGGPWTKNGSAANFAVTGGVGQIKMTSPGSGPTIYLNGVTAQNVDAMVDISLDKGAAGGPVYTSLSARRSSAGEYFAQVRWMVGGQVTLDLVRIVGGVQTTLKSASVAGLTVGVGDTLRLRFQATGVGPTTLNAKVWKVGTSEPAGWLLTTTDSSAGLQGPGAVGLRTYLAGAATNAPVTASFDNFLVN